MQQVFQDEEHQHDRHDDVESVPESDRAPSLGLELFGTKFLERVPRQEEYEERVKPCKKVANSNNTSP